MEGKWRKLTIGVKRKGGFLEEFVTTLNENNETESLHGVPSIYASVCQDKKPTLSVPNSSYGFIFVKRRALF